MKELAATFVPFTAQTRMSGIDAGSSSVRKGAVDAILNYIGGGTAQTMADGNAVRRAFSGPSARKAARGTAGDRRRNCKKPAARRWRSPRTGRLLGVIHLKDIVKGGIRERFAELRRMGIRTGHDHRRTIR